MPDPPSQRNTVRGKIMGTVLGTMSIGQRSWRCLNQIEEAVARQKHSPRSALPLTW
jgi:hypothetical protein